MKVNEIRKYSYKNGIITVYSNGHTRVAVNNQIRWFYSNNPSDKDIKAKQLITRLSKLSH